MTGGENGNTLNYVRRVGIAPPQEKGRYDFDTILIHRGDNVDQAGDRKRQCRGGHGKERLAGA